MSLILVPSYSTSAAIDISAPVKDRFDFLNRIKVLSSVYRDKYFSEEFACDVMWKNKKNCKQLVKKLIGNWASVKLQKVDIDTSQINKSFISAGIQHKEYIYCNEIYQTTLEVASKFVLVRNKSATDIFDELSLLFYSSLDNADSVFFSGVEELLFSSNYKSEQIVEWIISVPKNIQIIMILEKLLSDFDITLYLYQNNSFESNSPSVCVISENDSFRKEKWLFFGMFEQNVYIYYAVENNKSNAFPLEPTHNILLHNLSTKVFTHNSSFSKNLTFDGRMQLIQNEMKKDNVWHRMVDPVGVTVFRRHMNAVFTMPVTPQDMKTPISLANQNYCVLHQFGAFLLTLNISKYRSLIPTVNRGHEEIQLLFRNQHLVPISNTPFYEVFSGPSCAMTLEDAHVSNFQNFKYNQALQCPFHDLIETSTMADSAKPFDSTRDFGYLSYEGKDPGVYQTSRIVNNWTHDPENDLDKMQTVEYQVTVGDSFSKLQCAENHLLKMCTLISGTKIWFIIPTRHHVNFEAWMNNTIHDMKHQTDNNSSVFISPDKIPSIFEVTFAVQNRGETMMFDCGAMHMGFNIGFTVSATTVFPINYWKYIYNFQLFCNKKYKPLSPKCLYYLVNKYNKLNIYSTLMKNDNMSIDTPVTIDVSLISKPTN